MEALKRLGHNELKLDEYERVYTVLSLADLLYNTYWTTFRQSRQ